MVTETASASFGCYCVSATRYRRAENVRVVPIVVAELKFGDVQRQIFAAHFVEAAHDPALQKRPKAVDGLGMDNAIDILAGGVPHGLVLFQFPISWIVVSRNQANFVRNCFAEDSMFSAKSPAALGGQGRPVRRAVCDASLALIKRETAAGSVRRHQTPQHDDSQNGTNFLDPNALPLRDVNSCRWRLDK
jgi:hypothetical protein